MEDPIALRIFENALRSGGHFIARREPVDGGTRFEVKPYADATYAAVVVIPIEHEEQEQWGWRYASLAIKRYGVLT